MRRESFAGDAVFCDTYATNGASGITSIRYLTYLWMARQLAAKIKSDSTESASIDERKKMDWFIIGKQLVILSIIIETDYVVQSWRVRYMHSFH